MSLNGAKLPLNKGPPRKATIEDMSDAVAAPTIITPHALPMFRDSEVGRSTKRKREKERMDPRKSRRPELPVTGPGRGGRVGASATQHVVQNLVRDTTRDEDVRATAVFLVLFLLQPSMVSSGASPASLIADISGYPSSIHRAQMSEGPSPARDARVVALIEQNVEKGYFARREGLSGPWKGPIRAGLAVAVVTRRTRVAIRNRLRRSKSGPVSPCRLSSHLPLPHDVLRPSVCVEGPVVLRLRLLF